MRHLRQLYAGGVVAFAVLCVLALVFYKERMVLPDDANYIFELVTNGGHFAVFHYRFIAVLTQVLPYLAVKWQWPLDTVTWLYSLNIILFYAGCYLVCGLVFRNYRAALAFLLTYLLFTTHTFYWTVSELGQGIALLFVAFAMLSGEWRAGTWSTVIRFLLLAILVITAVYAHGLTFFAGSFMVFYLWLDERKKWRWLLLTVGLCGATIIFKRLFTYDEYDKAAMGGLGNIVRLFPNYFSTESMRFFASNCLGAYCWIPIIFILNVVHYVRSGSWLKLALMTCYCFGYVMLTTVAFPNLEGGGFYNENLLLPMAVFLCVPLVYDALPSFRKPVLSTALVVLIVAFGLLRIWYFHKPYSARLAWQRGIVKEYDGQKVVLTASLFPKEVVLMAWASPYEFWLLSTMEQGKTASILITDHPELFVDAARNGSRVFLPTFGMYHYEQLSPHYFIFRDTVNSYRFIP